MKQKQIDKIYYDQVVTELRNIQKKRDRYYKELENFENVTRARRIRINIELDILSNREKKIVL